MKKETQVPESSNHAYVHLRIPLLYCNKNHSVPGESRSASQLIPKQQLQGACACTHVCHVCTHVYVHVHTRPNEDTLGICITNGSGLLNPSKNPEQALSDALCHWL